MDLRGPDPLPLDDPVFAAVRDALPAWAPWAGSVAWWGTCALATALGTWATLRWARRPLRRAAAGPGGLEAVHWTERARLRAGPRQAAAYVGLVFPVLAGLGAVAAWGPLLATGHRVHVAACVVASLLGHLPVATRMQADDPVVPRRAADVLRGFATHWALFGTMLPITVLAAFLMPSVPDARAWAVYGAALLLMALAVRGGVVPPLRWIGAVVPADDRIVRLVAARSAAEGRAPPPVATLRLPMANAVALPSAGLLLVTERVAREFPDDEVAAIIGHELGHLAETRGMRTLRFLRAAAFLGFAWTGPLLPTYGLAVALLPGLAGLLFNLATQRAARRLEERADQHAHAHGDADPAALARGLERLARSNETPVATGGRMGSHPDVYDRMLAAGVQPGYPRPERPPRSSGVPSGAVAAIVVALAAASVHGAIERAPARREPGSAAALLAVLDGGRSSFTYADLALGWAVEGRTDSAVRARRAALSLETEAWTAGEWIAVQLATGDAAGARQAYARWAATVDPTTTSGFWVAWRWCRTAFELGELEDARAWLAAAVRELETTHEPGFLEHLSIGPLRARLEGPASARSHAEGAAAGVAADTDPWTVARVAFLFHDAGLPERAAEWLARAEARGREAGEEDAVAAYIAAWRADPAAPY